MQFQGCQASKTIFCSPTVAFAWSLRLILPVIELFSLFIPAFSPYRHSSDRTIPPTSLTLFYCLLRRWPYTIRILPPLTFKSAAFPPLKYLPQNSRGSSQIFSYLSSWHSSHFSQHSICCLLRMTSILSILV